MKYDMKLIIANVIVMVEHNYEIGLYIVSIKLSTLSIQNI